MAVEINRALSERGLTDAAAANLLDLPQPNLAALKGYKLDGNSVGHLIGLLTTLSRDVEI